MPVIGFLGLTSPDPVRDQLAAFHRGLKEAGYVEGQHVAIEYRWANNQYDRLAPLAAELARRPVAVIVAAGINLKTAKTLGLTVPPTLLARADEVIE